jgi:hypothetical protein
MAEGSIISPVLSHSPSPLAQSREDNPAHRPSTVTLIDTADVLPQVQVLLDYGTTRGHLALALASQCLTDRDR